MYDVFTTQLGIPINQSAADCLKLNFEGNAHLDKNEVDQAITCYDKVSTTVHAEAPPFPVSRIMMTTSSLKVMRLAS